MDLLEAETESVLKRISVNLIDAKLEADAVIHRVLAEKKAAAAASRGGRGGKNKNTQKANSHLSNHAQQTVLHTKVNDVIKLVKGRESFMRKLGDASGEGHSVGGKTKVQIPTLNLTLTLTLL